MYRKQQNIWSGNVRNAPDEVLREVLALEEAQKKLSIRERAEKDFMVFVKHVWDCLLYTSPSPRD